jgi:hypothetical protein
MKKSRTLQIACAIAVSAMVVGCSSAATSPSAKVYTMKDMTVGFIQTGSESGWRAANTSSFKETATADGINLKFYDSQNKIENQITAFNTFIQDPSVNVIVLAAVGTTGYDDVLKAAKAVGKVVVIEDRRIEADSSLYYTYIGSDFDKEGNEGAAAMCTALKGMSGANVVEIGGDQAASAAIDRAKGFREGIANCTDESIKILDTQPPPPLVSPPTPSLSPRPVSLATVLPSPPPPSAPRLPSSRPVPSLPTPSGPPPPPTSSTPSPPVTPTPPSPTPAVLSATLSRPPAGTARATTFPPLPRLPSPRSPPSPPTLVSPSPRPSPARPSRPSVEPPDPSSPPSLSPPAPPPTLVSTTASS